MYKLRTSIVKHENPMHVIFPPSSILFLWGFQGPQLLHYLLSGNKWGLLIILFAAQVSWETCFCTAGKQNSTSEDSLASITTCFKYGKVSLESKIYSLICWKCRRNSFYIRTSISARKKYPTVLALSPHTHFHYSRINFEEKEWIILAFCHSKYVKQT